jgi:hypothetical protein
MSVQHQRRRILGPKASHEIGTARRGVKQLNVKTPVVEHGGEGASAITLAR